MDLNKKRCIPCEGLAAPITNQDEDKYIKFIKDWKLNREKIHKLNKNYILLHFKDAISFVNQIAEIAEDEGHHPNIFIKYNQVEIEIYTHAINGLSENDFILAKKIDNLFYNEYEVG